MDLQDFLALSSLIKGIFDMFLIYFALKVTIKAKLKVMNYLIAALINFALGSIANFLAFSVNFDLQLFLIFISLSICFVLIGTLLFFIFFETFSKDNPLSLYVFGLIIICTALITILATVIYNILISDPTYFIMDQNGNIWTGTPLGQNLIIQLNDAMDLISILTIIMYILVVIRILLAVKISEFAYVRQTLIKILIPLFFYFTASILFGSTINGDIFSNLSIESRLLMFIVLKFFQIIGIFSFFLIFIKQGLFLLHENRLQILIISDYGGIPFYKYDFSNMSEKDSNMVEILISGALNAISEMLSEVIGNPQILQEIHMDNSVLIIRTKKNVPYILILIVSHSNQYYRDASKQIMERIFTNITFRPSQALQTDQKKKADTIIEEYFGMYQIKGNAKVKAKKSKNQES